MSESEIVTVGCFPFPPLPFQIRSSSRSHRSAFAVLRWKTLFRLQSSTASLCSNLCTQQVDVYSCGYKKMGVSVTPGSEDNRKVRPKSVRSKVLARMCAINAFVDRLSQTSSTTSTFLASSGSRTSAGRQTSHIGTSHSLFDVHHVRSAFPVAHQALC